MKPAGKIAVLGATGMLGHRLFLQLSGGLEVVGTARRVPGWLQSRAQRLGRVVAPGVEAGELDGVTAFLDEYRPDAVLNCIGIVKQLKDAKDPVKSITVNSLFPHRLAAECGRRGIRMIHFSTDCVFSGEGGPYRESDTPDPVDLYGRSKLLGEVTGANALTIRSSIIGHELANPTGLLEWVISQRGGRVSGYTGALYSGVTTNFMARLVQILLRDFPDMHGLWQLASQPINKYDLIGLINRVYGLGITVEPDREFYCDRRLDGSRFSRAVGMAPPPWEEMIEEMHRNYLKEYSQDD